MKSVLLSLFILLLSNNIYAQEKVLTFSYWSEAGPPFVFLDDSNALQISHGIVKGLADLISERLNMSPRFVNIPVKRTDAQLSSGDIDLNCLTNPIWKEVPDDFYWSPALFKGSDRFLVKSSKESQLVTFDDLKGKSLGVYNGYTYHPQIMGMIKSGDINAVKVSDIDHGIQLLLLDRIDALIDFDILLEYKIKTEYPDTLVLADLYAESYDLFCAYSKKISIDRTLLDSMFDELISKGEINRLLNKYN